MRKVFFYLGVVFAIASPVGPPDSLARTNPLTPDQQARLKTAHHIWIHAIALTENGPSDPEPIQQVVSDRLKKFGFKVVGTPDTPHDVTIKVKCEERRSRVALAKIGGDADQPGTPSRLWKGPACQLTYRIDETQGPWRQEVRTAFEDVWTVAQKEGALDSGTFAMNQLRKALERSDFPLQLIAEWRQEKRLATLLTASTSSPTIKGRIIELAKRTPGETMLQALTTLIADERWAPQAIRAMGYMGTAATSTLVDLLENSASPTIQASAAYALGEIGALSGDMSLLPPLLAMMEAPQIDLGVQTEIVRAVGKIPDHHSVAPLQKLGVKAWTSRSQDPRMQKLREAIDWSLWQINPSAHTDD